MTHPVILILCMLVSASMYVLPLLFAIFGFLESFQIAFLENRETQLLIDLFTPRVQVGIAVIGFLASITPIVWKHCRAYYDDAAAVFCACIAFVVLFPYLSGAIDLINIGTTNHLFAILGGILIYMLRFGSSIQCITYTNCMSVMLYMYATMLCMYYFYRTNENLALLTIIAKCAGPMAKYEYDSIESTSISVLFRDVLGLKPYIVSFHECINNLVKNETTTKNIAQKTLRIVGAFMCIYAVALCRYQYRFEICIAIYFCIYWLSDLITAYANGQVYVVNILSTVQQHAEGIIRVVTIIDNVVFAADTVYNICTDPVSSIKDAACSVFGKMYDGFLFVRNMFAPNSTTASDTVPVPMPVPVQVPMPGPMQVPMTVPVPVPMPMTAMVLRPDQNAVTPYFTRSAPSINVLVRLMVCVLVQWNWGDIPAFGIKLVRSITYREPAYLTYQQFPTEELSHPDTLECDTIPKVSPNYEPSILVMAWRKVYGPFGIIRW